MFLSGAGASFVGSPGVLQGVRLKKLLESKRTALLKLEDEVIRGEEESGRLEKSRLVQEREIRRSLGYAAPDELIFDFTASERDLASRR
jgi:cell division protein FtsB